MAVRSGYRPWNEQPHIVDRVLRVYDMYLEGISPIAIAEQEKCSYITVWRDIQRGKVLYVSRTASRIEQLVEQAVIRRESIMEAAFRDRRKAIPADAAGRAALLRVIGENATAVEELQHLRGKDGSLPAASFTLVQSFAGSQPVRLQEMSDEELGRFKESLKALPEPEIIEGTVTELPEESSFGPNGD